MSMKRYALAVAAMASVIAVGTLSASAATTDCAQRCISLFSKELGTYAQPNVVEAVLDGVATVGQPVILKAADRSDDRPAAPADRGPPPAVPLQQPHPS